MLLNCGVGEDSWESLGQQGDQTSWMLLWRPTRPARTNNQKRCHFHYRGLECKSRKSRDTWSNRQIWPLRTEWSRAKASRVLLREHTGHSKHPLPTHKRRLYTLTSPRWSTPKSDWLDFLQPKMEKLYLYSQHKQDQELTMAQIMNSLLPNSDLKWRK